MRNVTMLALLGTSLVTGACSKKDTTDTDSADSVVDDSSTTESEGNVMMAAMDGADMTGVTALDAVSVSARIAANAGGRWLPAGCETATANGSNVVITLDDCTGPRGLVHVTGELDLAVSVSVTGGISVHATASDLQVNRAVLTLDATGSYTVDASGEHSLTVQSTASGTGPLGTDIDHQGDYTVSWDPTNQCRSLTGQWQTDFSNGNRSAERSNDIDLSRCGDACPTGMIVHHGLLGLTLTITFDGTNVAQWSIAGGRSGTVNLTCQ